MQSDTLQQWLYYGLLTSIALFALSGIFNVIRFWRGISGDVLPAGYHSSRLFWIIPVALFAPVRRNPLGTVLLCLCCCLSLFHFRFDHYFINEGRPLFASEYTAALLGSLAFVGSSILAATATIVSRVNATEDAIFREIFELVDKMDLLAPQLTTATLSHSELLVATYSFRELQTPQHLREQRLDGDHYMREIRKITQSFFEPGPPTPAQEIYANYALRLENIGLHARVNFVRSTLSASIWTRMSVVLFVFLIALILVLTASSVFDVRYLPAISDGAVLWISVATITTIWDFISYQIQETRN